MDSAKSGSIMMSVVYKYFSPLSHPDVIAKHKTVNELTDSLFSCLQNSGSKQDRGCVTYAVSQCEQEQQTIIILYTLHKLTCM